MLGVDDSRHDVATESGTNLIEQVVVVSTRLWVVKVTNLQLGTVGSQTACQRRRHAWTEVTANHGSAHEADLRFLLFEQVDHQVGVWCRGVWEQPFTVKHKQLVNTIGQYLILDFSLDSGSSHDSMKLHTKFVGEFASFGQQLL